MGSWKSKGSFFLSCDAVFRHHHLDLKTAEPGNSPPHTHTPMLYGITRGCNSHPSPPSEVERDSVAVWTSSTVSYKAYSNLPCRTAWVKDAQSTKSKWNPGPHTKMHRFLCRSGAWKCLHLGRRHRLRNWRSWGWRDVWVVKSICCSTRGLEFISQNPYQMAHNQL